MKKIVISFIKFYQFFTPLFSNNSCRFYPSCSSYAKEAVEQKGTLQGLWAALKRILRCHPLCDGGYDPVI